jgi:predicted DNA-binding protein (MmcQ/YjbR family)
MHIEAFRVYCLSLKGVTEEFPFDSDTLAFKVIGKIFALTSLSGVPFRVNLKMNPDLVEGYRASYADVTPGYHMNKKHWNSVYMDTGAIPRNDIYWMINHSYQEVVKGMTKKGRDELEKL